MNKIIVSTLVGVLILPFSAFAETQDQLTQHIALLQQVVVLLEQELALLINQQSDMTDTGNQDTQNLGAGFSISVNIEQGEGSWAEHNKQCNTESGLHEEGYDCDNTFLDGMVKFTVSGGAQSAVITYYPTDNPSDSVTTGGLYHNGVIVAGTFQPNTEYHWSIVAKNADGESSTQEDVFTTGDYTL